MRDKLAWMVKKKWWSFHAHPDTTCKAFSMYNKDANKTRGYMTVELIMALIVGAILIISLNVVVTSHLNITQRGKLLLVANSYAEQKIEALRSRGYLGLTDGTTDSTTELPSDFKPPRSATVTVSALSSSVKKVHLSITYSELGVVRTQSYTTYIGELGVGQY